MDDNLGRDFKVDDVVVAKGEKFIAAYMMGGLAALYAYGLRIKELVEDGTIDPDTGTILKNHFSELLEQAHKIKEDGLSKD